MSISTPHTYALNDVWGISGSDVFAVGNYGTILHYDGSTWSPMWSGADSRLHGVWISPDRDAFAVGYYGAILGSYYSWIQIRCTNQ